MVKIRVPQTEATRGLYRYPDDETSVAAAHSLTSRDSDNGKMLVVFYQAGERGLNAWEAGVAADLLDHEGYHHRCTDICNKGWIVENGEKRPGRTTRERKVWVITDLGRSVYEATR